MFYDIDNYNCRNMSIDIEDMLESIGIDVTIVRGTDDDKNGHMWVKIFGIEFDSVYLMPFMTDKYHNKKREFNDYNEYLEWRKV